mgnify:CR=1 FL=1
MIEEAPIKTTVEELRKLIHISNYVGEPIESEDKILTLSTCYDDKDKIVLHAKLIKREKKA